MIIRTSDDQGYAICPVDETPVQREGEFCQPACWEHFHMVLLADERNVVRVGGYVELHEQPWYGGEDG